MKRLFSLYLTLSCVLFFSVCEAQVITCDDADASDADTAGVYFYGAWAQVTDGTGYYGTTFRHDNNGGKGSKSVSFQPKLPVPGLYEVYGYWKANADRASSVPISIDTAGGPINVSVNQRINGSQWNYLAEGQFLEGTNSLTVSNTGTSGTVVADAFQWRLKKPIPRYPDGLRATPGNRTVTVQWNPVTDPVSPATSYRLYYGPSTSDWDQLQSFVVQGTTATVSYPTYPIDNGTSYRFRVKAINDAGMSYFSVSVDATPQVPPVAPTNLSASPGDGLINLSWSPVAGATSYKVFRVIAGSNFDYSQSLVNIAGTSYTNRNLTNNTTYYYVVRAVKNQVEGSSSDSAHATPLPAPSATGTRGAEQPVGRSRRWIDYVELVRRGRRDEL